MNIYILFIHDQTKLSRVPLLIGHCHILLSNNSPIILGESEY